jgi:hypothetical protein
MQGDRRILTDVNTRFRCFLGLCFLFSFLPYYFVFALLVRSISTYLHPTEIRCICQTLLIQPRGRREGSAIGKYETSEMTKVMIREKN